MSPPSGLELRERDCARVRQLRRRPAVLWLAHLRRTPAVYLTSPLAAASDPGIPWGAILGCKAAWACWIGHTVYSWNFYTLLTQLPSILSLLLHLDGENAGMIMSMSYVLMLVSSVLSGIAADCILASNGVSTCAVRKAAEVISVLVPSVQAP